MEPRLVCGTEAHFANCIQVPTDVHNCLAWSMTRRDRSHRIRKPPFTTINSSRVTLRKNHCSVLGDQESAPFTRKEKSPRAALVDDTKQDPKFTQTVSFQRAHFQRSTCSFEHVTNGEWFCLNSIKSTKKRMNESTTAACLSEQNVGKKTHLVHGAGDDVHCTTQGCLPDSESGKKANDQHSWKSSATSQGCIGSKLFALLLGTRQSTTPSNASRSPEAEPLCSLLLSQLRKLILLMRTASHWACVSTRPHILAPRTSFETSGEELGLHADHAFLMLRHLASSCIDNLPLSCRWKHGCLRKTMGTECSVGEQHSNQQPEDAVPMIEKTTHRGGTLWSCPPFPKWKEESVYHNRTS